ncbi:MAG: DUF3658 domain-containing protein [Pseudomonadota bacterium]
MAQKAIPEVLSPDRLQILLSASALGSLRRLMQNEYGSRVQHYASAAFLMAEVGPVSILANAERRLQWFGKQEGDFLRFFTFDDDDFDPAYPFGGRDLWKTIENWSGSITFWMSSRSASDRSFLCFLAANFPRVRDIDIVDVTRTGRLAKLPASVGECNFHMLGNAAQNAVRLSDKQVTRNKKDYEALSAYPLGLRVLKDQELVEVPVDFYDVYINAAVTSEWLKLSHVVGRLLAILDDTESLRIDFTVLLWRLSLLEAAGLIERRGESTKPLFDENPLMGEVRLSSRDT